jgi:hypothetical protein
MAPSGACVVGIEGVAVSVKRYKWLGDLIYVDGHYAYPDNPVSLVDSADYDALVEKYRKLAILYEGTSQVCDQRRLRVTDLELALKHIREEAYGDFYVEGNGRALEEYCAKALGTSVEKKP